MTLNVCIVVAGYSSFMYVVCTVCTLSTKVQFVKVKLEIQEMQVKERRDQ
jgi:hypothetical protein